MAKAINDGLFNYEDELWDPSDEEAWVSRLYKIQTCCTYFLIYPLNLLTKCLTQIETGSGDKQSNVSLVSREDFERLKNLTSPLKQTQNTVEDEVCFSILKSFP